MSEGRKQSVRLKNGEIREFKVRTITEKVKQRLAEADRQAKAKPEA